MRIMTAISLVHKGEDITDYFIGDFNDLRLTKIGALLYKRICNSFSLCLKQLGQTRAGEVSFGRFLRNTKVSIEKITKALSEKTNNNCKHKEHVLCIQDTVQCTYPTQTIKKRNFGPTGKEEIQGFFVHPGIIVDAETKDILGVSSITAWIRTAEALENNKNKNRPIEEKESIRWLKTINETKETITNAKWITVIGDRESDIYELFARTPDNKTYIITRSNHDREIEQGIKLSEHMRQVEEVGTYELELPEIAGKRKARMARIAIKYDEVIIQMPKGIDSDCAEGIKLTCIEANEIGIPPKNESAISWRLLTTHTINDFNDAYQIILWYTWRWIIEQLFRTMKKRGLVVEDSQIENPEELLNMFVIGLAVAVKTLCLVYARDGSTKRGALDIFSEEEICCLAIILTTVEGKTKKQQNPYNKNSLSWASWIIARLGGWNCYGHVPGPITMHDGLMRFENYFAGWLLAQKNVCIR